mgnify:FL=1|tara:strand:+ start:218 stop:391 length:174 start_codon:yes stop_codon:yes gene_type:complete
MYNIKSLQEAVDNKVQEMIDLRKEGRSDQADLLAATLWTDANVVDERDYINIIEGEK